MTHGRRVGFGGNMHAIAPIPILFGIAAVVVGLFWLVAAGSEEDDGPDVGLTWIFGMWYIGLRVARALAAEPMSVLPGFAFVAAGAGLIGLGMWMV